MWQQSSFSVSGVTQNEKQFQKVGQWVAVWLQGWGFCLSALLCAAGPGELGVLQAPVAAWAKGEVSSMEEHQVW